MKDLLQTILDNQLEDLSGTRIQGQVCLQDSFVNALLQPLTQPGQATATPKDTSGISQLATNAAALLSQLKIHTLRYETAPNKTMISVDVEV